MQLLINPGVTTIADCSEMEGDALSDVDGEGALLNPINFLGEERRYEDEDGGFEMDSENGQLEENEDRADTDIEEAGPEVGGVASSEGRDSHAEDEETRGTLGPAATVVDVPPKDYSFPRRQRPRTVFMISDDIEGEETTGGGGGAEVDMDNETSEVVDSVIGAIGIGVNYSAASAQREKVSKLPSVVRRAFSFAASVDHSSSLVAAGTIQPDVLVLPRQTSKELKEVNPALGNFSSSQTQQRGPMAVKPARQEEAPRRKTHMEVGEEARRKELARRPPPPPPRRELSNEEARADSAARFAQNKDKTIIRRW